MPKKAGTPKTGGRKKGTPNTKTLSVQAIAEKLGVCPIEILFQIATNDWDALGYDDGTVTRCGAGGVTYDEDVIQLDHRLHAAKELAQYLYPKRKALELSNNEGEPLTGITFKVINAKGD